MTKIIKDIPLKTDEKNAYLRYLTTTDLPDILELQTTVYEALEDKKDWRPWTKVNFVRY